jgi:hypothetical protein
MTALVQCVWNYGNYLDIKPLEVGGNEEVLEGVGGAERQVDRFLDSGEARTKVGSDRVLEGDSCGTNQRRYWSITGRRHMRYSNFEGSDNYTATDIGCSMVQQTRGCTSPFRRSVGTNKLKCGDCGKSGLAG